MLDKCDAAVQALVEDLSTRQDFEDVWESVDEEVHEELYLTWRKILKRVYGE